MNVPGILYIPTKSLDESTPNSSQFEVVAEKHFTFNSEFSLAPGGGVVSYLSIPLNEFRVDDASYNNKRYNAIIVNGYAINSPSISNQAALKFHHCFVTDWNTIAGSENELDFFNFEDQVPTDDNNWNPIFAAAGWVNGEDAVNGSQWDFLNNQITGWSCGEGDTASSLTGPAGGVDLTGTTPPFEPLDDTGKYLYAETTSPFNDGGFVWVARSPGINFSTAMDDTSNQLNLEFYVHGFGSNTGTLVVYIDTASTSNAASATVIDSFTSYEQDAVSDPYTKAVVDLNAYRTVNNDHYIYFVYQGNNGFRGDVALDAVSFQEVSNDLLNFSTSMTQVLSPGVGSPLNGHTVTVENQHTNSPIINFKVQNTAKDIYIKGSYLLM